MLLRWVHIIISNELVRALSHFDVGFADDRASFGEVGLELTDTKARRKYQGLSRGHCGELGVGWLRLTTVRPLMTITTCKPPSPSSTLPSVHRQLIHHFRRKPGPDLCTSILVQCVDHMRAKKAREIRWVVSGNGIRTVLYRGIRMCLAADPPPFGPRTVSNLSCLSLISRTSRSTSCGVYSQDLPIRSEAVWSHAATTRHVDDTLRSCAE